LCRTLLDRGGTSRELRREDDDTEVVVVLCPAGAAAVDADAARPPGQTMNL
jgi:hypothetical protein